MSFSTEKARRGKREITKPTSFSPRLRGLFVGSLLLLALWGLWLGQGRAQAPDEPVLRIAPLQSQPNGDDSRAFVPGVVLVRLMDAPTRAQAAAQRLGVNANALTQLDIPGQAGLYQLTVPIGAEESRAASLAARADVLFAEPDYLFFATETTPNDTLYAEYQWNLRHIRANSGWDRATGSSGVIIAIADTGIDLGHPDLAGKIVGGIDAVNNDFTAQDDNGHGTHVASIAAGQSNNARGIAGVDWNARLMPVKVLNAAGNGSSAQLADGLTWAADNGANVLNMSLASANSSSVVRNAVQYAYERGVLLVAAAGNSYIAGNPTSYPAAYDHVIGVAAVNDTDGHASYSNSGSYVDVAAPGGDPSSSSDSDLRHWIPGAYWRGSGISYALLSGTSQAAPHVAGLAGLLLALNGSFTPDQLAQLITSSAVDVQAAGWDPFSGYGRIDVAAAMAAVPLPATATPTSTPTGIPTATVTATVTSTPTAMPTSTPTPTPPPRSKTDVQINDISTNTQDLPALAIDSANNLTALWRDRRSGTDALYSAQLASDAIDWGESILVTRTQQISSTDRIGIPGLAAAFDGGVVAIWHDSTNGEDQSDIFASRLDRGETVWDGPAQVNGDSVPPASQVNPAMALADNGALVAAWEDSRSTERADASTQLYWSQSNGSINDWAVAQPISPTISGQISPGLAIGGGIVYAVWVEQTPSSSVLATTQRPLTGTVWMTPTVLVVGRIVGGISAPNILADAAGNLLAVWQEDRDTATGTDIYYAQRRAGGDWSTAQRIGKDRSEAAQSTPRLAKNGREVVLVWQDMRNGNSDIYVSWAAWPVGEWLPAQRVNQDIGTAEQFSPDVAIDRWGNTTVVWSDERNPSSAPDIYARFIPAGERFRLFLPGVAKP